MVSAEQLADIRSRSWLFFEHESIVIIVLKSHFDYVYVCFRGVFSKENSDAVGHEIARAFEVLRGSDDFREKIETLPPNVRKRLAWSQSNYYAESSQGFTDLLKSGEHRIKSSLDSDYRPFSCIDLDPYDRPEYYEYKELDEDVLEFFAENDPVTESGIQKRKPPEYLPTETPSGPKFFAWYSQDENIRFYIRRNQIDAIYVQFYWWKPLHTNTTKIAYEIVEALDRAVEQDDFLRKQWKKLDYDEKRKLATAHIVVSVDYTDNEFQKILVEDITDEVYRLGYAQPFTEVKVIKEYGDFDNLKKYDSPDSQKAKESFVMDDKLVAPPEDIPSRPPVGKRLASWGEDIHYVAVRGQLDALYVDVTRRLLEDVEPAKIAKRIAKDLDYRSRNYRSRNIEFSDEEKQQLANTRVVVWSKRDDENSKTLVKEITAKVYEMGYGQPFTEVPAFMVKANKSDKSVTKVSVDSKGIHLAVPKIKSTQLGAVMPILWAIIAVVWMVTGSVLPAIYAVAMSLLMPKAMNLIHSKNKNASEQVVESTAEEVTTGKKELAGTSKDDSEPSFDDSFNESEIRLLFPGSLHGEITQILSTVEDLWASQQGVRVIPEDLIELGTLYKTLSDEHKEAKLADLQWMVEQIKKKADGFVKLANDDTLNRFDVQVKYYKNQISEGLEL